MSEAMNKRRGEVLDYVFDFSRWLSPGDTITNAEGAVAHCAPSGTIPSAAIARLLFGDTTATAWVAAGAAGETAIVTVTVTTAAGRRKVVSLRLRITE